MNSSAFISRARELVLDNLLNSQFGVASLAKELGISRSELYKRIRKIENKSASQFIREIRLEKALELLRTDSYSIGEIAYMVGFNSPTYFSSSFKDFYGYSPSVSKENGYVPKTRTSNQTRRKALPIVLGGMVILILVFWSLGAFGGSQAAQENTIELSVDRKTSLEAYRLYLEARELGEQRKDSLLSRAIGLLEEAVALDPSFAEAYAELSYLHGQWYYYGSLKKDDRDKMMKKYLEIAMGLDPESPEVLLAKADLAWKNRTFPGDSTAIITAFQNVLDKDANNDRAHYRLYQAFRILGKYDISHSHLEAASDLDPQNSFYQTILARDLFWKRNERENGLRIINEVFEKNPRPAAVYFKALMTAEQDDNGHVMAFKILSKALKEEPFTYGYMYWGTQIAMDLDFLPFAKKYTQLIQIRFPENRFYTYGPAFDICITEKRYEDALDLTRIYVNDKGLNKKVASANIARIHYLKGDHQKSSEILLNIFSDVFDKIENSLITIENIQPEDIEPITTYIEVLRKSNEIERSAIFADFLCSYYGHFKERKSWTKKLDQLDCHYLQNDMNGFLIRLRESFFVTKNRLAIYSNLKSSRYPSFENNIEYQKLFQEIETEMHLMRSEVIEYLKNEGDWDPLWDDAMAY